MSHKKSQIGSLLAARLRPQRRPPTGRRPQPSAPVLRLTHAAGSVEPQPLVALCEDSADVLRQVRDITRALATAEKAIDQIQHHLAQMAQIAHPADFTERRCQAEMATKQAAIDQEIQAIDRLAASTENDGAKLLDGTWSVAVADPSAGGVRTLRIAPMASRELGRKRIGGFVAELASEGSQPFNRGDLARGRAVIRCAMLQVAAVREQVAVFQRDALNPLTHTLEVVTANLEAAHSSAEDMDFAHQASQLTRLDALLHVCPDGSVMRRWQTLRASDPADDALGEARV